MRDPMAANSGASRHANTCSSCLPLIGGVACFGAAGSPLAIAEVAPNFVAWTATPTAAHRIHLEIARRVDRRMNRAT
jgi:hypothetical protein